MKDAKHSDHPPDLDPYASGSGAALDKSATSNLSRGPDELLSGGSGDPHPQFPHPSPVSAARSNSYRPGEDPTAARFDKGRPASHAYGVPKSDRRAFIEKAALALYVGNMGAGVGFKQDAVHAWGNAMLLANAGPFEPDPEYDAQILAIAKERAGRG